VGPIIVLDAVWFLCLGLFNVLTVKSQMAEEMETVHFRGDSWCSGSLLNPPLAPYSISEVALFSSHVKMR
jgi:hypothetical protein